MCDFCGRRRSGLTAELADEHVRLQELSDRRRQVRETDAEAGPVFDEFVRLLQMHAAKEEVELFPHVFHALDREQCDDIELAHRAVEAVWNSDGASIAGSARRGSDERR